MLQEDRKRFPPKSKKANGTLLWDCHPAKLILREDVAAKKNQQMTPRQLQASNDEYKKLELKEFRPHIYQENRRRRFLNHLNNRREEKKIIHCCKPPVDQNGENPLIARLKSLGLYEEPESSDDEMDLDNNGGERYGTGPPNKKQKQN